jgi:hypothetical protein
MVGAMKRQSLLLVLVVAVAACKGRAAPPEALPDLSASMDALRTEFNAHHGENRFIALLSPT